MKSIGAVFFLGTLLACSSSSDDESLFTETETPLQINQKPEVDLLQYVIEDNEITIDFELFDPEDDLLEVQVLALYEGETEFVALAEQCGGNIGTPQSQGVKSVSCTFSTPILEIKVIVDDGFTLVDLLSNISADRIKKDVETLSGLRHHSEGENRLKSSRDLLRNTFGTYGLSVRDHEFTHRGIKVINVIGSREGTAVNPKRLIVGGHFDTIGSSPGADDNASGTAGVLEAMRILSQIPMPHSIDFIGLDLEEFGLIGSSRYVVDFARDQEITGFFNFEMIGYPCRTAECEDLPLPDTSIYSIALPASVLLLNTYEQMVETYVRDLKVVSVVSDGDANHFRSDHAPFWRADIPALFLTDGANFRNPHYHQATDLPGTLDYEFAKKIVQATVASVVTLGGWNPKAELTIILEN